MCDINRISDHFFFFVLRNCVTKNERNRATLFPKTPKLSGTFHFECLVAITNLVFVLL